MDYKLLTNRHKINFRNSFYNKVQDLCFELFGKKAVIPDRERDMLSIICPISLSLTFDWSEPKIYFWPFFDCNENLVRARTTDFTNDKFTDNQIHFPLYNYEDVEKYLRFKKQEVDLINEFDPYDSDFKTARKEENFRDFTKEYLLPAIWALPIFNGDFRGITDEEKESMEKFLSSVAASPIGVESQKTIFMERSDDGTYDVACYRYIFAEDAEAKRKLDDTGMNSKQGDRYGRFISVEASEV